MQSTSTQNMNTFKIIFLISLSWNLALSVSSSQLYSETYTIFSEKIEPKLELNSSGFCCCYPFAIFADQLISSFLLFDFLLSFLCRHIWLFFLVSFFSHWNYLQPFRGNSHHHSFFFPIFFFLPWNSI